MYNVKIKPGIISSTNRCHQIGQSSYYIRKSGVIDEILTFKSNSLESIVCLSPDFSNPITQRASISFDKIKSSFNSSYVFSYKQNENLSLIKETDLHNIISKKYGGLNSIILTSRGKFPIFATDHAEILEVIINLLLKRAKKSCRGTYVIGEIKHDDPDDQIASIRLKRILNGEDEKEL